MAHVTLTSPDSHSPTRSSVWVRIWEPFWVLPLVIVTVFFALGLILPGVDERIVAHLPFSYTAGPEAARSVLSTIASAMISVTGLVFSITLVVLQLASSQFSPLVLSSFLSIRINQVTLGFFLATFLYSLTVLRTVRSSEETLFAPQVSTALAFLLVIVSVMCFLAFIHNIMTSIQVSHVISRLGDRTRAVLEDHFPTLEDVEKAVAQAADKEAKEAEKAKEADDARDDEAPDGAAADGANTPVATADEAPGEAAGVGQDAPPSSPVVPRLIPTTALETVETFERWTGHPVPPAGVEVTRIRAATHGMVTSIDYRGLMSHAEETDTVVSVLLRPGSFVPESGEIALAWRRPTAGEGADQQAEDGANADASAGSSNGDASDDVPNDTPAVDEDRIRRAITLRTTRSVYFDPAFGLRQISDIATRALSSGTNDPTTAVGCVHEIRELVGHAVERPDVAPVFHDSNDVPRVYWRPQTVAELIDVGFTEIIHYQDGDPIVVEAVSDTLEEFERRALPQHLPAIRAMRASY